VDINTYDQQRSDLKDYFTDHLGKIKKQEISFSTKMQAIERDLRGAEIEIKRLHDDLTMKCPIEEAGKLWRHFSNFAEYKDFKSLYNKVIPEMSKHEQNMQEHRDEITRFGQIV
jgi:hypothetical protein